MKEQFPCVELGSSREYAPDGGLAVIAHKEMIQGKQLIDDFRVVALSGERPHRGGRFDWPGVG